MQTIENYENKFGPLAEDDKVVMKMMLLSKLIEISNQKINQLIVKDKNNQKIGGYNSIRSFKSSC